MKIKVLASCLFLLSAFRSCLPQSDLWYLTRGGQNLDQAWGVAVDSSGNIYFATCETPPFSFFFDIYLYKFDSTGHEIWKSQPWGGAFNDKAFIAAVKAPYVYVAGRTDKAVVPTSADAVVLAFSMNDGSLLWQYTWDGSYGYEEIDGLVIEENAIYLAGWTTGATSSNDFLLQKINLQGQLIWSKTWGSEKWDDANGHLVVDSDHIYVAGRINAANQLSLDGDAALVCFSKTDGTYLWHRTWGGNSFDDAFGLTLSSDSFLYLVGITLSSGSGSQIFLLKYTKTGELLWSSWWGGPKAESARAIVADGDSIIYVAGKTESYGAGANDIALIKFDSAGTVLWHKTWGGNDNDEAHELAIDSDFLYLAGETNNYGAGKSDALLLKARRTNGEFPSPPSAANFFLATPILPDLKQNYPNPFNAETIIEYQLNRPERVEICIFNLLGQKVATSKNENHEAGVFKFVWDGTDLFGSPLPSGVYLYQLRAENFSLSKKLLLLR